jgi:hypothetical protein
MQFIRDLREVTGALKELVADDERHEEDAKLELAFSAQSFAQETREVVDDKLSFSATLMRAGEVDAAQRLLAEVEAEVRDNEVALIEQVNEVKVARAARRERITRMRLARSLAVAMLGAAVMAMSAAGMAFASFLEDRSQAVEAGARASAHGHDGAVARAAAPVRAKHARDGRTEKVRFGGVTRSLTPKALAAYEQLTSGDVGAGEMEQLLSLLPPELAHTMRRALTTAKVAEKTVKEAAAAVLPRPSRSKAKAGAKEEQVADEDPKEEPSPSPEPTEEPSPEPDPTPTEEPEEDPDGATGLPDLGAH